MKKILFLLSISIVILFTNAAPATVKAEKTMNTLAAARQSIAITIIVHYNSRPVAYVEVENATTHQIVITNHKGEAILDVKEGDKIVASKGRLIATASVTVSNIFNQQLELNLVRQ